MHLPTNASRIGPGIRIDRPELFLGPPFGDGFGDRERIPHREITELQYRNGIAGVEMCNFLVEGIGIESDALLVEFDPGLAQQ